MSRDTTSTAESDGEGAESVLSKSLRADVYSAARGAGLSVLLLLWAWWVFVDWGASLWLGVFVVFGVVTLLVFTVNGVVPALKLHRRGEKPW